MNSAEIMWFVMGAGVIAYALTGGADFGGGVWHLFARGTARERDDQRRAIEHAIAPIWEATHVWLIFVIVMMFTAFPRAFAAISIALHIPITLALVGIVMRGSAFVFYAYDLRGREHGRAWSLAFGISSLLTPLVLGAILGALSSGAIRWDGEHVTTGYLVGWTGLFALGTGVFATALFALLSAVYLAADTAGALSELYRKRALWMEGLCGVLAFAVFVLAEYEAPLLFVDLAGSSLTPPIQIATALAALTTIVLLFKRRVRAARFSVALQVGLVVIGWGFAMGGRIVLPDITLANAGTRSAVVSALLPALAVGALLLGPSLWYLFRIFKSGRS
jgi:cytochrome d ubiquinol oxidase subunit II